MNSFIFTRKAAEHHADWMSNQVLVRRAGERERHRR